MKKFFLFLSIAFLSVAGIVTLRTIRFPSRQQQVSTVEPINLDTRSITERLSRSISYRTVSDQQPTESFSGEFLRFHQFLQNSFPQVHTSLTKEVVGEYSLLYTWKGTNDRLKPILLMGHMDVVPVDPSTQRSWTYPPFSGRISDGYIWGRGAMDDKISVMGILEAVEQLLREGFQPQRTIYLGFGHDEEIGGQNGAAKIAALLRDRQVGLDFVLDEGGNVTDGIVPGISSPVAMIGIAEKGYLNLELTVNRPGGHASTPPDHTAIGILSSAIHKLERAFFPSRLTEPTRKLLEFIGSEMGSAQKMMVANLWLFEPWVRQQMENSPLAGAMIRTTQAATIFEAGVREDILPGKARVVINYRLLPGDTTETVIAHVRKIIGDPQIEVAQLSPSFGPSPVSDTESDSFNLLQRTIRQIAPHAIVAPFLLVGATDSRYYVILTKNIYRFLPITIRAEDAKRYHGVDERVSITDYEQCIRFFIQLIRNANTLTLD